MTLRRLRESFYKQPPVVLIENNGFPAFFTGHNVKPGILEFDESHPRHRIEYVRERPPFCLLPMCPVYLLAILPDHTYNHSLGNLITHVLSSRKIRR